MLCPEVWNFAPPSSLISTKWCESNNEVLKTLKNQFFTQHISITLPNTLQIPQTLKDAVLDDSQYYRVNNISAAEFFDRSFVDLFVRRGKLTATSISSTLDTNDALAFIPDGKLILTLTKKTYCQLGIEGKFVKCENCDNREYSVVLDLLDSKQMGKNWKQIFNKLKLSSYLFFDVVLAWEPNDIRICPSSIALYFSKKDYNVSTCDLQYEKQQYYDVKVPVFDRESDASELTEWLGAFNLQCTMSDNSYISTMKCPERCEEFKQAVCLNCTGLLTIKRVQKIISEMKECLKEKPPSDWMALIIQGFENSAINTKNKNLFQFVGDQCHAVFFKNDHPTLVWSYQSFT